MKATLKAACFVLVALACSACGMNSRAASTATAQTAEAIAYLSLLKTATAAAQVTDTPTATRTEVPRTPTRTSPPWCGQSAAQYLRSMDRLYGASQIAITRWNNSPRGEAELLEMEITLRDLIAQTEALEPPSDYQEVQVHFLAGMQAVLYAIFGITDESEGHLEGSNATYQEEIDLAWEERDLAGGRRGVQCR